jgi:hypothetical protein
MFDGYKRHLLAPDDKKKEQIENYDSADRQTKEQNSMTAAHHKLTHNLLQRVAHITDEQ